jgi:hypothetical protein
MLQGMCRLLQKSSLFVLPTKDAGLKGMVVRLESAFHELSTQYYHQMAEQLQTRIEGMNQSTEKVMIVRYTIKIGYFNELRQNRQTALLSYQQAYALLKDVHDPGIGAHEIKSVAGLLMTKICQLLFQTQSPRDSIKFLREHVAFYGTRSGKVQFLHSQWLSTQYCMFALVFGEAIKRGLQAVQTEHPGFYFFEAAQHTVARKRLGRKIDPATARPAGFAVVVNPPLYEGQFNFETTGTPESAKTSRDKEVFALTAEECAANHSQLVVEMTEQAQHFFKMFNAVKPNPKDAKAAAAVPAAEPARRMRMLNRLNVYISEELFEMKEFERALELVEPTIGMYRDEEWASLLGSTLSFSYKCAYITNNINTYLARSIELCGAQVERMAEQRTATLENFLAVCNNTPPSPPAGQAANPEWTTLTANIEEASTVDMTPMKQCIECKVCFAKTAVPVNEEIVLLVAFRSWLPAPIAISAVIPTFDHPSYASPKVQSDAGDAEKMLAPGETTIVTLTLPAAETDAHEIRCTAVAVQVGGAPGVQLTWAIQQMPSPGNLTASALAKAAAAAAAAAVAVTSAEKAVALQKMPWEMLESARTVEMKPMPSLVSVLFDHAGPALVNERYPIKVRCTSEEKFEMSKVCIRLSLVEGDKAASAGFFVGTGTASDDAAVEAKTTQTEFNLEMVLAPGGTTEHEATITFTTECEATLAVSFEYSTALSATDQNLLRRSREFKEVIKAIKPFQLTAQIETLQRRATKALTLSTPYLVAYGARVRVCVWLCGCMQRQAAVLSNAYRVLLFFHGGIVLKDHSHMPIALANPGGVVRLHPTSCCCRQCRRRAVCTESNQ